MTGPKRSRVRKPTADALLARAARAQVDGRAPSTAVGVVRDGMLVWSTGRGTLDGTSDGPAPTLQTQYRIGSITKTFTAVLVLQLRDEGLLDLEDRLDRHLDGTPFGALRIRDLLAHAAGLAAEPPGPWWERVAGVPWPEFAATLGPEQLLQPAGRFHYSNIGFALLGEVVARRRGTSWYSALRSRILDPLGLRDTTDGPGPAAAPGLAVHPFADAVLPEVVQDHGSMAPAGQLWSTVADLARWASFIAGDTGRVLAPQTVAEMRRPQVVTAEHEAVSGYGLGLQLYDLAGRGLVGHGGSVPGFLAYLAVDVDRRTAVVELANATAGQPFAGGELLAILEDCEPTVPAAWSPATGLPADWPDLVGLWHWGPAPFLLRMVGSDRLDLGPARTTGRETSFVRRADAWVGENGYWAGETLSVVRRPDGSASHLDAGTFVLTREPYETGAPIPGGLPDDPWAVGAGGRP